MIRRVEVRPPSQSRELGLVLRAAAFVVFVTLFVVSVRRARLDGGSVELFPYQRLFADLPPTLQRDYRELREGFVEAARIRGAEGRWPDVARLASEGIPPFSGDGVDGRVREWKLLQAGTLVWYLGTPIGGASDGANRDANHGASSRPLLLLQVIEPAAGDLESASQRTPIDEVHQRLSNGMLVHVTTWYRDALSPDVVADAKFRPEDDGFLQMIGRNAAALPKVAQEGAARR